MLVAAAPAALAAPLAPSAAASVAWLVLLAPSAAASVAWLVLLAPSAAASVAWLVLLAPSAAASVAWLVLLAPSAAASAALPVLLAPSAAASAALPVLLAPSAAASVARLALLAPSAAASVAWLACFVLVAAAPAALAAPLAPSVAVSVAWLVLLAPSVAASVALSAFLVSSAGVSAAFFLAAFFSARDALNDSHFLPRRLKRFSALSSSFLRFLDDRTTSATSLDRRATQEDTSAATEDTAQGAAVPRETAMMAAFEVSLPMTSAMASRTMSCTIRTIIEASVSPPEIAPATSPVMRRWEAEPAWRVLKVATASDSWPARRLEHTASSSPAQEFSLVPMFVHVEAAAATASLSPASSLSQSFKGDRCSMIHPTPADRASPRGSITAAAVSAAVAATARPPETQLLDSNASFRSKPSSIRREPDQTVSDSLTSATSSLPITDHAPSRRAPAAELESVPSRAVAAPRRPVALSRSPFSAETIMASAAVFTSV